MYLDLLEIDSEFLDPAEVGKRHLIEPVHHGHKFDNMFKRATKVSLGSQKVISSLYFDQQGVFAGLTILDTESGTT